MPAKFSKEIAEELSRTVKKIAVRGKGILAADESAGTMKKLFDAIQVENTEANRVAYRHLLFSTKGLGEYISGATLSDETLFQEHKGQKTVELLQRENIIIGVKVDIGLTSLLGTDSEKTIQGPDGLEARCQKYYAAGARFAKWRAELEIDTAKQKPSQLSIQEAAHALARFAATCQENKLVPVVELEILTNGDHSIECCAEVTENVLAAVVKALFDHDVLLEGTLLAPNMVTKGADCEKWTSAEEVAFYTVRTLKRAVPPALGGIMFLSGDQCEEEASLNLNAMNSRKEKYSWTLSFSYGSALQASCLKAWMGKEENCEAAQKTLLERADANSESQLGKYKEGLETEGWSCFGLFDGGHTSPVSASYGWASESVCHVTHPNPVVTLFAPQPAKLSQEIGRKLAWTARKIAVRPKGILAADESTGTLKKLFDAIQVENTEANRAAYRHLLFSTKGLGKYISGAILCDETLFQEHKGQKMVKLLKKEDIIPGIKVDLGLTSLSRTDSEKTTLGPDGLAALCQKYYVAGARFANLRAVLEIDAAKNKPSQLSIQEAAHILARYAAICQKNELVPIIEPDILTDGNHSVEYFAEVTENVLATVFKALSDHRVLLEGALLKPNMVTEGTECEKETCAYQIAYYTTVALLRTVPPALVGITFPPGGQSNDDASLSLSAMYRDEEYPWTLSCSYSCALQASCLKVWAGKEENIETAQEVLLTGVRDNFDTQTDEGYSLVGNIKKRRRDALE